MSGKTHYEILGITESATLDDVKGAYRKLALRLHPDTSDDPKTTEIFMRVSEAYQVLSDAERRANYDIALDYQRRSRQEAEAKTIPHAPTSEQQSRRPNRAPDISARIAEAAGLFAQGKYDRAEIVAKGILRMDSRVAMPHAILGDISRTRGDIRGALEHYSYAIQHEPGNQTYQRRYEQIFLQVGEIDLHGRVNKKEVSTSPLWVVSLLSAGSMAYVAIARESPIFPDLQLISAWTVGLVVMMFLSGVMFGAALSITQTVDRWESVARGSAGRLSPVAALGLVAIVNFWASGLLYVFLGLLQNSFTYSVSRLLTVVAILAASFALMSNLSPTLLWPQTLLWGGNVIYLGALCGWAVADAFR